MGGNDEPFNGKAHVERHHGAGVHMKDVQHFRR